MAKKNAPLFRKSMSGFNKDDVNNYILSLNRTLEENKRQNEKNLSEYNLRAEEASARISELEDELAASLKTIEELRGYRDELSELKQVSSEKDSIIADLNHIVNELREKVEKYEAESDNEKEKAEQYDSLCSKAGEILVIASSTAEDILNRANTEALKIVGDANTKKDLMLKTFSASVDAAADDINTYIKSAVDRCVVKINESVKEVAEMAGQSASAGIQKKPRTIYIHNVDKK